jgi:hypothetical protein
MKMQNQSYRARAIWRVIAILAIMLGLPAARAAAQSAGGTILGVVTDPTGAIVDGGTVTITNIGTGVDRVVETNEDGLYVAPNLIAGAYNLTIAATGFTLAQFKNVVLTVGERREVDVRLTVGQVTSNVTVSSGDVQDVDLASSAISGVVESHTVVDLPLNGRDWTSLTLLEPGVAQVVTQKALGVGNDRANRGLGMDITVGGNRPQGNNYRLDGVSVNDYSSGGPGSITGGVMGVDAVQEFSVVTSNAPADYGKTAGGVINAASRTGTNSFHGTAYEFLRNSALDARNFFDTLRNPSGQLVVPPFKRNQFGASAGGPIFKDHTFFFADYEGLRQRLGTTGTITVPTPSARTGALVGGAVPVDPRVAPFLVCNATNCLFPLPNDGITAARDTGTFSFVGSQPTTEDFLTARIDHRISGADSLFGTFVFDRAQISNPDAYDIKNNGNQSRRYTVALEESHVFSPSVVNTGRFGFNRDVVIANSTLSAINPAASNLAFSFDPGRPAGIITVGSGVTQFTGGIGAISEYDFHYNSFQAYDDVFWTKSKHSLKLGVSVERIQSNQFTRGSSPNGMFTFGSLANFLQDIPSNFNTRLGAAFTPRDLRQTVVGAYVQDDYKIRSNLTLNLGLRYEMATVPTETAGQLATLVNLTDAAPKIGSPYFSNATLRNFAPRLGFSWDPFGTGKTTVRGAFGIYDVLPLPYQFELLTLLSAPFTEGGSITTVPGDFPTAAYAKASAPQNLRYGYVEPHPHRSYVDQWSLSLQREIIPTLTVTAGYVGSHGVHLPGHTDEINDVMPLPQLALGGYLWPTAPNSPRLFTNPLIQGQVSANTWSASSSYDGLTLQANKRVSHGVQIQTSYTFSKSIDTSSSGIAGDTFGNSVSSLPFFDPRLRRGLSDFDVQNVLAINALWQISTPTSWNGAARAVAGGWQVGGIFTLSSGLPFTPTIGGDPLGLSSADNYAFPNRITDCKAANSNFKTSKMLYLNPACFAVPTAPVSFGAQCKTFASGTTQIPSGQEYCANLLGDGGRNTVIGPGLRDLDFSLFKNNPIRRISETFNVQFRWEVFNIVNHANFAPPAPAARQVFTVAGALNPTAGVLSATSTNSRQMQFALKLIW